MSETIKLIEVKEGILEDNGALAKKMQSWTLIGASVAESARAPVSLTPYQFS